MQPTSNHAHAQPQLIMIESTANQPTKYQRLQWQPVWSQICKSYSSRYLTVFDVESQATGRLAVLAERVCGQPVGFRPLCYSKKKTSGGITTTNKHTPSCPCPVMTTRRCGTTMRAHINWAQTSQGPPCNPPPALLGPPQCSRCRLLLTKEHSSACTQVSAAQANTKALKAFARHITMTVHRGCGQQGIQQPSTPQRCSRQDCDATHTDTVRTTALQTS